MKETSWGDLELARKEELLGGPEAANVHSQEWNDKGRFMWKSELLPLTVKPSVNDAISTSGSLLTGLIPSVSGPWVVLFIKPRVIFSEFLNLTVKEISSWRWLEFLQKFCLQVPQLILYTDQPGEGSRCSEFMRKTRPVCRKTVLYVCVHFFF